MRLSLLALGFVFGWLVGWLVRYLVVSRGCMVDAYVPVRVVDEANRYLEKVGFAVGFLLVYLLC